MAANKRKILELARKLVQKGARAKALKEYEKLLKFDPKDAKLRLEIGDAHRRWGQVDEAIETYGRVAEQYMSEGFDARAVAVFKQILNLAPDRLEAYAPLAELYERMGLTAEAINALQTAADGYHRAGRKAEALELLRKMANADPSNTTSRIKVADLLRQEGQTRDAVAEYQQAAAELARQGDTDTVATVYRRILELDDTDVPALTALAQNLVARGKVAEAIPLAERALELDGSSVERHEELVELYERTGREEDRSRVFRSLSEVYRNRGDEDRAREILQRFVPTQDLSGAGSDPVDELSGDGILGGGGDALFGEEFPETDDGTDLAMDFGRDLGLDAPVLESPADPGPPAELELDAPVPAPAELELDDAPLAPPTELELDAPLAPSAELEIDAPEPASPAASPLPVDLDADRLLAEASVYLRYDKRDKAVAHLERVIDAHPDHRGALEKLGEAFAEGGENDRAVEVWMRAAKRAGEDQDEEALRVLRGRIAVLDEAAAESLTPAPPDPSQAPATEPELAGADDELDYDDDDEFIDDELEVSIHATASDEEPPTEIEFDLDVDPDGADDTGPSGVGEVAADDTEPSGVAADDTASSAIGEAESSGDAGLSASMQQQVVDDLEEADFYLQQGLQEEAQQIYQRVLATAPNHPRALVRLGEIAASRGESPSSVSSADPDVTPVPVDEEPVGSAVEADAGAEAEVSDEEISIDISVSIDEPEPSLPPAAEIAELSDLDLDGEEAGPSAESSGDGDGSDTQEFEPNVETPDGPVAADPPGAGAPAGEGHFDLAAVLSGAFEDEPGTTPATQAPAEDDGFAAVFNAFKKGVSETLDDGDHQAHYDLAIAYKEMGLLDDAINELRAAMANPARTAECLHLIGLCAIDADQAPLAVEHLEQLLTLPSLAEEAVLAGRFDLGRARRALGDLSGARREWEAVAAVRSDFQDVGQHLAGLDEPPTDDPGDEEFESFDDVMEAVVEPDDYDENGTPGESFDDLVAEVNAEDDDEDPTPEPTRPSPRRRKKISFM